MQRVLIAISLLAASASVSSAQVDESSAPGNRRHTRPVYNHPIYVGLELNYNLPVLKTSTSAVKYNAPGHRLIWGTHLNSLISFQTYLHNIGHATSANISTATAGQEVEASAMGVAALLHVPMPLGGMVVPYVKIGGQLWQATYKDSAATPTAIDENLSGTHVIFGFGTDMVMSEVFSIALEMERSVDTNLVYQTFSLLGRWRF